MWRGSSRTRFPVDTVGASLPQLGVCASQRLHRCLAIRDLLRAVILQHAAFSRAAGLCSRCFHHHNRKPRLALGSRQSSLRSIAKAVMYLSAAKVTGSAPPLGPTARPPAQPQDPPAPAMRVAQGTPSLSRLTNVRKASRASQAPSVSGEFEDWRTADKKCRA